MINYSLIEKADMVSVIYLQEKYLNSGTYIRESIEGAFNSQNYIGIKACEGEKIIGFFSLQKGIAFTYPHEELEKEVVAIAGTKTIYTVDGFIVLEQYRNQGIAGELICRMREVFKGQKDILILIEMWIYPDGTIPAEKPLAGIGKVIFQKECLNFYERIQDYEIGCPLCGKKCECGAKIEILTVEEDT